MILFPSILVETIFAHWLQMGLIGGDRAKGGGIGAFPARCPWHPCASEQKRHIGFSMATRIVIGIGVTWQRSRLLQKRGEEQQLRGWPVFEFAIGSSRPR
jgi:hypothetical protein